LKSKGATVYRRVITIPEGGKVMQMKDPFGNIIGLKR
jgi:predicted enzyme related to lactoylglutathione lyase